MIVISDLHFGKTNDSFLVFDDEISGKDGIPVQTLDLIRRLNHVLVKALMSGQSICIAGDVFNRVNPTTQIISFFFSWLGKCRDNNVKVIILGGNHDAGVSWSSMSMFYEAGLGNVSIVTRPNVIDVSEKGGKAEVLFWPHIPLSEQDFAIEGHGSVSKWVHSMFPDSELVITHGTISSCDSYSNDIFFEAGNSMKVDPSLFKKLKVMVLGHIHTHMKGKNWVYPGSVTINNFGEVEEKKGWVELDLSTKTYQWFEFPDDITPWVDVVLDLTDKDESEIDEESIKELVTGAIVKVTVLAKSYGVIHESNIRKLFNKYGYVSKFETTIVRDSSEVEEDIDSVRTYEDILREYVDNSDLSKEMAQLVYKNGVKIISEVRA
jgi:DNA repair exonuclease SbcCD nuclease subunit